MHSCGSNPLYTLSAHHVPKHNFEQLTMYNIIGCACWAEIILKKIKSILLGKSINQMA